MVSEKRIAYPVEAKVLGTPSSGVLGTIIRDANGRRIELSDIAEALNAAKADAERYRTLRAILQGDRLADWSNASEHLMDLEHAMTDCTGEEIDAAVDAAPRRHRRPARVAAGGGGAQ